MYPESEKWSAVHECAGQIEEFVSWLGGKGIGLARPCVLDDGTESDHHLCVGVVSPKDLIYEFFGIDRRALDRERRAMLAAFR